MPMNYTQMTLINHQNELLGKWLMHMNVFHVENVLSHIHPFYVLHPQIYQPYWVTFCANNIFVKV